MFDEYFKDKEFIGNAISVLRKSFFNIAKFLIALNLFRYFLLPTMYKDGSVFELAVMTTDLRNISVALFVLLFFMAISEISLVESYKKIEEEEKEKAEYEEIMKFDQKIAEKLKTFDEEMARKKLDKKKEEEKRIDKED